MGMNETEIHAILTAECPREIAGSGSALSFSRQSRPPGIYSMARRRVASYDGSLPYSAFTCIEITSLAHSSGALLLLFYLLLELELRSEPGAVPFES